MDELKQEYSDVIENGDNIFTEYMDNMNNQAKEEQSLADEINSLANKNNIVLTSKLSANRSDFERLKNQGDSMGQRLETKVGK